MNLHALRLAFAILLSVEFLSALRVLRVTLDFTWLGLLITSSAVWIGLELVHRSLHRKHHRALPLHLWWLAFFAVAFDAFGDINRWYSAYGWYDRAAHLIASGIAAVILFHLLRALLHQDTEKHHPRLALILSFTSVATLGVLYEVEEYLEDVINLTNRLGDAFDTVEDLIFNILGAGLVLLLYDHFRNPRLGASAAS